MIGAITGLGCTMGFFTTFGTEAFLTAEICLTATFIGLAVFMIMGAGDANSPSRSWATGRNKVMMANSIKLTVIIVFCKIDGLVTYQQVP